jgi:ABC-2 type transport system permease protein
MNYLGTLTLIKKEIYRFLKVYHQTIFSPIVNIILFLLIFSISVGKNINTIEGVDFAIFVASGLIIMSAMQNAFANSSSSLVMSKVMGHIVDYLIPPISALELLLAFLIGAVARGVLVALAGFLIIFFLVSLPINHLGFLLLFLFLGCCFLGLLGILCGILSDTFDQMSALTSYLITPLTFLSGTFYSINSLSHFWQIVAKLNPFFYIIDGFRYGITGHHDGNLTFAILYLSSINIILFIILLQMLKTGYRIKN